MIACVDTNVLIDILRGYKPATEWYRVQPALTITVIVAMEVVQGTQNKVLSLETIRYLDTFETVLLTDSDQLWAAFQHRTHHLSHRIEFTDCLIASVCWRLQVPLYTNNLKHMRPLLGDLAISPY